MPEKGRLLSKEENEDQPFVLRSDEDPPTQKLNAIHKHFVGRPVT
jgi:hypothetical protein